MDDFDKYDLSSLKNILGGGEPSTPDLIREVYRKLKCTYVNEFGMTEGLLCRSRLTDDVDTICSTVGKPCCPYETVKVVNENGEGLPPGTDGEWWRRGPAYSAAT